MILDELLPPSLYGYGVESMSKSSREGEILTIKQVAEYLKVTERTIYRWAAVKKVPACTSSSVNLTALLDGF